MHVYEPYATPSAMYGWGMWRRCQAQISHSKPHANALSNKGLKSPS